jgi:hypothetical protein
MDWPICHICGACMQLVPSVGQWVLCCPNRNDGRHPVIRTCTSNGTAPATQGKEE